MAARDLFIEQLVAALQENEALAGGASSVSSASASSRGAVDARASSQDAAEPEKSPGEHTGLFLSDGCSSSDDLANAAHTQLQFDFPQVQEESIEALAELYRRLAAEESPSEATGQVPITATLLDGVAFLNDQGGTPSSSGQQRTRGSEGGGLLAAAVLLLVFRRCLETSGDSGVNALLKSLRLRQPQQETLPPQVEEEKMRTNDTLQESDFVEKYAAQEDPDDLSEVYEGHLPVVSVHQSAAWKQVTPTGSKATTVEKLRYLAAHTFSSSFEAVSMEKWDRWGLDDELIAIMRLLVEQEPEGVTRLEVSKKEYVPVTLYGPRGEWSRYLYVLRDRVLRFPGASRNALWQLKELIEFLQQRHTALAVPKVSSHRVQQPQHLVYRVLAELAISREFNHGAAQRAQQGLALAIQELLPLITEEVHQLAAATPTTNASRSLKTQDSTNDAQDDDDDGDDELAVVFLQLLHFLLFVSPNARTTTEKLHESGILRTLLTLLPPAPSSGSDSEQQAQYLAKRWFPALLRLLGECALWHAGFAGYIIRVPKFVGLIPTLREELVAEELILALAFHQHQVQARTMASAAAPVDIWEVFTSPSMFPEQCDSYFDAMKKLQDAVFVLDCLEKVLPVLRPAVHKDLQRSLQQIYGRFARSFEYPTFADAEAARQQQQFEQQVLNHDAIEDDEEKKEKKEEDRGQAEAMQFTALRNKLRQSVKSLLSALSSGPAMGHAVGRASSKLD